MSGAELVLPRLSDSMEEGSVVRWLKRPGDAVTKGEALVEVDTDKVTVVIEAPADGFLGRILVAEGATAKVGATLAAVVDDPNVAVSEAADDVAEPPPVAADRAAASTPAEQRRTTSSSAAGPLRATPLARKLAKHAGLDLTVLAPGSGPNGRILRQDVDRASQRSAPRTAANRRRVSEVVEPSRLHVVLARRMTEAKQQIPHYYVTTEVDVTDALRLQDEARQLDPPLPLSMTHLVVSSCAFTLAQVPEVNSSWVDGKLVRHAQVNVGIAVALEDDGLIVPVLEAADRKSLREIVAGSNVLVEKARSGRLTPDELGHGTFTVSNLGMFSVDEFHAIINPPESGILAIGAANERAVVRDGDVVVRSVLRLSLSADHRVFSGVVAARFLNAVRTRLEHPLALCLPPD